jgi:hypothetical protein
LDFGWAVRRGVRYAPVPAVRDSDLEALMNRLLIGLGALIIIIGVTWPWIRRVPLFHLPGDIVVDRPGFKFFMPITTMLLISVVLSVLAWLLRR